MAVAALRRRTGDRTMVGGYAALAEGSWMGAAQATEVLDTARLSTEKAPAEHRARGWLQWEFTAARASIILMGSFLFSAVLGALRQALFNAQFGAGVDANAYYAAFRLPDTLFSLIAGGALSSAMIPVLIRARQEDGDEATIRLGNLVLNALVAAVVVAVVLGELAAPLFVSHVLAPGFDAHTSSLTVSLTRIMLIQPLILALGSVVTALLNSRNQFLLTALSVASHNIGLIGGILLTHFHHAFGIYGPTLGVVAGAVIQMLILLPGMVGNGFRFHLDLDFHDARLRQVIALLIPNGLAVGVGYAGFIADTAFASKASESAALPALHNAWMLVGLPIALFGQAVGQSVFPRLSAHAESGQWLHMRRSLLQALLVAIALAVVAVGGMLLIGKPAIHILFQHGKYNASASDLTYRVLVPYSIALPAYVATEIVSRGLIALRDTRTPLLSNSAQLAGRILFMALLLGALGVRAIPVAFALLATIETVALATVLLLKLRRRISSGSLQPSPLGAA